MTQSPATGPQPLAAPAAQQHGSPQPADDDSAAHSEHRLVTEHLGLARAMARRFVGRGADNEDLFQVAYLGLVTAARRYDPKQGSFSAFAAPTVRGELKKYFRDKGWMVRPPRWIQELQADIRTAEGAHLQQFGEHPSDRQLALALGCDIARIREARGARGCFAPTSFDLPMPGSDKAIRDSWSVEEAGFQRVEDVLSLAPACRDLDTGDRNLLRMRFVEERTQQDIADELGISQMQVSRRLSGLLARLRDAVTPDAA